MPDDLRQYFSKYGTIKDVYIPKPARSFAFVTFHDSNVVRTLFGTHIINGKKKQKKRNSEHKINLEFRLQCDSGTC
mgnify:CR=1 FL=1